jgi:hypothetical protein
MEHRSLIAHKNWQESSDKFDYFICGVSGSLFAYIAQTYTPQRFETLPIEPLALLFLALSFYTGAVRIETANTMKLLNHEMLDASEKAGEMTKALAEPSTSGLHYNAEGGEIRTRADIEKLRKSLLLESRRSYIKGEINSSCLVSPRCCSPNYGPLTAQKCQLNR